MASIEIKDAKGKKVGTAELADGVFGIEPNTFVVHQVVRSQMAARRSGTHDSKTRGMVSGGGKKPWRQKGTGRARQGTTRAPQWKGGGAVFGPHPRSYAFKVPNKVVKLAMRSVLSAKLADESLFVIDGFAFDKPATKAAADVLKGLGITGRVTIVVEPDDVNAMLSFRNLPRVRVITASEANTYDLVDNTAVLFTKPALTWLEGVLS
ncbi:MAG: 50S ribosomal protein L4 [Actinobacteria bacterium HGW-Actinobacteria-7]|jgi:large subunit ribosomal protein L4|nr:MAG: 50S ribosomal protein L4 [Actinobacteria bacterium HGW-Actinobacteria-7]